MHIITAVKKPIEIKAIRYTGDNGNDILRFMFPEIEPDTPSFNGTIKTLEGEMKVSISDYVIKGIKGEFYPCKPEIFEESYDIIGEENLPSYV